MERRAAVIIQRLYRSKQWIEVVLCIGRWVGVESRGGWSSPRRDKEYTLRVYSHSTVQEVLTFAAGRLGYGPNRLSLYHGKMLLEPAMKLKEVNREVNHVLTRYSQKVGKRLFLACFAYGWMDRNTIYPLLQRFAVVAEQESLGIFSDWSNHTTPSELVDRATISILTGDFCVSIRPEARSTVLKHLQGALQYTQKGRQLFPLAEEFEEVLFRTCHNRHSFLYTKWIECHLRSMSRVNNKYVPLLEEMEYFNSAQEQSMEIYEVILKYWYIRDMVKDSTWDTHNKLSNVGIILHGKNYEEGTIERVVDDGKSYEVRLHKRNILCEVPHEEVIPGDSLQMLKRLESSHRDNMISIKRDRPEYYKVVEHCVDMLCSNVQQSSPGDTCRLPKNIRESCETFILLSQKFYDLHMLGGLTVSETLTHFDSRELNLLWNKGTIVEECQQIDKYLHYTKVFQCESSNTSTGQNCLGWLVDEKLILPHDVRHKDNVHFTLQDGTVLWGFIINKLSCDSMCSCCSCSKVLSDEAFGKPFYDAHLYQPSSPAAPVVRINDACYEPFKRESLETICRRYATKARKKYSSMVFSRATENGEKQYYKLGALSARNVNACWRRKGVLFAPTTWTHGDIVCAELMFCVSHDGNHTDAVVLEDTISRVSRLTRYYYGNYTMHTSRVVMRNWFSHDDEVSDVILHLAKVTPENVGIMWNKGFYNTIKNTVTLTGRFSQGRIVLGAEAIDGQIDYIGTFASAGESINIKHGLGTRFALQEYNFVAFSGQFVSDDVNGKGRCLRVNQKGDRHLHIGNFVNNSTTGFGTQRIDGFGVATGVFKKGSLERGYVVMDKEVQSKYNLVFYAGTFRSSDSALGYASGHGVALCMSGFTYNGTFERGRFIRGEKRWLKTRDLRERFMRRTLDTFFDSTKSSSLPIALPNLVHVDNTDEEPKFVWMRGKFDRKETNQNLKTILSFGSFRTNVCPTILRSHACIMEGRAVDVQGNTYTGSFRGNKFHNGITRYTDGAQRIGEWHPRFTGVEIKNNETTHYKKGKKDAYKEKQKRKKKMVSSAVRIQRLFRSFIASKRSRMKAYVDWFESKKSMGHSIEMECAFNVLVDFYISKCRRQKLVREPPSPTFVQDVFQPAPFPKSGLLRKKIINTMSWANAKRAQKGKKIFRAHQYFLPSWWGDRALQVHKTQCIGERKRCIVTCKHCTKKRLPGEDCSYWKQASLQYKITLVASDPDQLT
jgi:hypothetical protein